jgi:predicted TIM-barrel fold metal-dependent hydrolase
MTVRENVEMGAFTVDDDALIAQRLHAVEQLYPIVSERAGEKAGSLSGGQQRLVEFARCLMLDPQLIMLDEPSMGLDPQTREMVFEMVLQMNRRGKTILLVEQNARAGLRLSSHGVVLENGVVRLTGSGQEVLEHPEIGALYLGGAVTDSSGPDEARLVCRVQNEGLARLVAAHPGRLSAVGAVAVQDPALAARELPDLMAVPGLHGVEIPSSVGGRYLGDDFFLPFWEAAAATGAVVFIHPSTRGFGIPALDGYYLWNSVGNPLETAVTAAHIAVAGVLERFPGLRILLAHGGGALPVLRGRLRRAHAVRAEAAERLHQGPDVSLRRFHYDTVTHDAGLLADLIQYAGPEQVLLGSDRPFDMGTDDPVGEVRALRLGPAEDLILGANAQRLLGLPVAGPVTEPRA